MNWNINIRDILQTICSLNYSFSKLCNYSKKIIALYVHPFDITIWHVLMYFIQTSLNNSAFRLLQTDICAAFDKRLKKKWRYHFFWKYNNWHSANVCVACLIQILKKKAIRGFLRSRRKSLCSILTYFDSNYIYILTTKTWIENLNGKWRRSTK